MQVIEPYCNSNCLLVGLHPETWICLDCLRGRTVYKVRKSEVPVLFCKQVLYLKNLTSLPLMVWVCENNIIFPCVWCPSICPSRSLILNHWAEFNTTCYMTSPHSKGGQKQYYFTVRSAGVLPSVCHAIFSNPLNHLVHDFPLWYFKGVLEQHFFSMHPFILRPTSVHLSSIRPFVRHTILSQSNGRN